MSDEASVLRAVDAYYEGSGPDCDDHETGTREHRLICLRPAVENEIRWAIAEAVVGVLDWLIVEENCTCLDPRETRDYRPHQCDLHIVLAEWRAKLASTERRGGDKCLSCWD